MGPGPRASPLWPNEPASRHGRLIWADAHHPTVTADCPSPALSRAAFRPACKPSTPVVEVWTGVLSEHVLSTTPAPLFWGTPYGMETVRMARRPVVTATLTLAGALLVATPALARAPAPLVPTALVEDVKSATADSRIHGLCRRRPGHQARAQRCSRSQLSQILRIRKDHRRHGDGRRGTQRGPGRPDRPRQGPVRRRQDPPEFAAGEQKRRQRLPPSERGYPADAVRAGTGGPASERPLAWQPHAADRTRRPARRTPRVQDRCRSGGRSLLRFGQAQCAPHPRRGLQREP